MLILFLYTFYILLFSVDFVMKNNILKMYSIVGIICIIIWLIISFFLIKK